MTQSLTRFRDIPPKVNPNVKVLTSSCVEIVNIWTPLFAIARIAKTQEDSSMTFICMRQPSVSRLCEQTRQGQPGCANTRFAADTLPPRPERRSCTKRPIKPWVNSSITSPISVRKKLDGLIVIRAMARRDLDERCLFAVIDPGFAEHVIPRRVLDLTRMHCPQRANVFGRAYRNVGKRRRGVTERSDDQHFIAAAFARMHRRWLCDNFFGSRVERRNRAQLVRSRPNMH